MKMYGQNPYKNLDDPIICLFYVILGHFSRVSS